MPAVYGFEGQESTLQLTGWSKERRVIILRQRVETKDDIITAATGGTQLQLNFGDDEYHKNKRAFSYKYSVLITSFFGELKSCAEQLTSEQRWLRILSKAVEKYLGGRSLFEPTFLAAPS